MMTLRFDLLIFVCIACFALVVGYLAGASYPDLISRSFTRTTASSEPAHASSGITMNLPRVVAPMDDGQEYYYVQATIALEIDHARTAAIYYCARCAKQEGIGPANSDRCG